MMRRLNQRAYVKGSVEYFTETAVSILLGHQYFPSFSHDISCITHSNSYTLRQNLFLAQHTSAHGVQLTWLLRAHTQDLRCTQPRGPQCPQKPLTPWLLAGRTSEAPAQAAPLLFLVLAAPALRAT